ncbi:MAG: hypothetical protein NUW06_00430 [Candidatus Acetothermia bacterium]|nr:hypothetical protein [Candidatus Acetothermia bacterium]MDH7504980.1 hypothetical protein [Candidatus Acetothermia bacterium]
MKAVRGTLGLIAVVLAAWSVVGQAQFFGLDPRLDWQVLETEHFSIIFPPGTEGMAQEAAELAEAAWQYWSEELAYTPPGKTAVVITPTADFSIGGATTIPNNEIMIGTSEARSFGEWLNSRARSALEQVIFHEHGHIVDTGEVSGLSKLLRTLFGAIIMPNGTKPGFFSEGVVISAEHRRSGASRSNDPRDAMYLREMWLQDLLPPLDRASQYDYARSGWPSGYMISHDYGAWLVRYLAEEYGPEKIAKIDRLNAESPLTTLSFGLLVDFGGLLRRALGVSAQEFFAGFKDWLGEQFRPELERIESEGVVEGKRISKLAYWNNDPAWSPDGHWIAYYHYDDARQPGIRLIRPDGSEDHQVTSFEPGLDFFRPHFWAPVPSWSPDGRSLVYAKLERYDRYYIYGDIYLYELATGKERRLTHRARAYNPVFFPDGQRLLFAKQRWGERSPALAALDLSTGEEEILQEFPDGLLIDSFSISPDGSRLALSIWHWGGFQDIYLLPAAGGELLPITQDRATDLDPTWSPDGRFVVFSSDRDGVNNLYAYRLADGAFFKVTNVTSGAFAPDLSPDGQEIAYVGYSVEGYDLRILDCVPESWRAVSFNDEPVPEWPGWPELEGPVHRYSPWPSLLPKLWLPLITPDGMGLFTFGSDYLSQHDYSLVAGYDWRNREPFYTFNYASRRLGPSLSLGLESGSQGGRQQLQLIIPVVDSLTESQELLLAYERRDGEDLVKGAWRLAGRQGFDLQREEHRLEVEGELRRTSAGPYRGLILDWRERLRLPLERENELALKLTYGWRSPGGELELGGHEGRFMLRGLHRGALTGPQALATSLEYRFLIGNIERGLGLWPFFLNWLKGSLFLDLGMAGERLRAGFGVELRPQLILGYALPLELRFGVAQGLGESRPSFYLALGSAS